MQVNSKIRTRSYRCVCLVLSLRFVPKYFRLLSIVIAVCYINRLYKYNCVKRQLNFNTKRDNKSHDATNNHCHFIVCRHRIAAEISTGESTKTSRSITPTGPSTQTTRTMHPRKRCVPSPEIMHLFPCEKEVGGKRGASYLATGTNALIDLENARNVRDNITARDLLYH